MRLLTIAIVSLSLLSGNARHVWSAPNFEQHIYPIVEQHCLSCHGGYTREQGLDLRTHASAMTGSEERVVIFAGNPQDSLLWQKILNDEMPKGKFKLSKSEKQTIQEWIKAGAPSGLVSQFPLLDDQPLAATKVADTIDQLINQKLAERRIAPAPVSSDAEFLRRVYLDLHGTIPSLEQTKQFLEDSRSDKRARLVDTLVNDPAFGRQLATNWHNLIVPFDEGKRVYNDTFQRWLAEEINQSRGWDQAVSAMLTATGRHKESPENALWTQLSEPNEAALKISRLFMGIQLECAECHDSPTTPWRQEEDFWGMAAFFGRVHIDGKGQKITVTESGGHDFVKGLEGAKIRIHDATATNSDEVVAARFPGDKATADVREGPLRPAFAEWLVAKQNPYFAKAAVNRYWGLFFGRGIVEPIDDMQLVNLPSHPHLLHRLTHEFQASGHDFKHLARSICNSQAYQRTSKHEQTHDPQSLDLFAVRQIKMLEPEVLYNAYSAVLGSQMKAFIPSMGKKKSRGAEGFVNFFNATESPSDPATYNHGPLQVLLLFNSEGTNHLQSSSLKKQINNNSPNSEQEVITDIYLSVLSRLPSSTELAVAKSYLQSSPDRSQGYMDLAWALLNSTEFIVNH